MLLGDFNARIASNAPDLPPPLCVYDPVSYVPASVCVRSSADKCTNDRVPRRPVGCVFVYGFVCA